MALLMRYLIIFALIAIEPYYYRKEFTSIAALCFFSIIFVTIFLVNRTTVTDQFFDQVDGSGGENNFAFDPPDLSATVDTPNGGQYQLEAFK